MTPVEHRSRNTIAIVFIMIIVATNAMLITTIKHDIHDCEARLFQKLTDMKAPDNMSELD